MNWTTDRPKKDGKYQIKCDDSRGVIEVKDGYVILGNYTRKHVDDEYFYGCEFRVWED